MDLTYISSLKEDFHKIKLFTHEEDVFDFPGNQVLTVVPITQKGGKRTFVICQDLIISQFH